MTSLLSAFDQNPTFALRMAAIACGVALLYLVMRRTQHRRRAGKARR